MTDLHFTVNQEACTACGSCVQDCPMGVLALNDEMVTMSHEDGCIGCQHCFAICPAGAIAILGHEAEEATPLGNNLPGFPEVATLIKGRRSVRQYRDSNVPWESLAELLHCASHAPTGHNSQTVQLTVIDDRQKMNQLATECRERLQQLAAAEKLPDSPLKPFLETGLALWQQHGVDIFFRGAPHLVIASAPDSGPSPTADTLIALSYLELAAQAMGLGTLWNGLAKALICTLFPDIRKRLNIPDDHHVGYVMLLGKPAVRYARTVERGAARVVRAAL